MSEILSPAHENNKGGTTPTRYIYLREVSSWTSPVLLHIFVQLFLLISDFTLLMYFVSVTTFACRSRWPTEGDNESLLTPTVTMGSLLLVVEALAFAYEWCWRKKLPSLCTGTIFRTGHCWKMSKNGRLDLIITCKREIFSDNFNPEYFSSDTRYVWCMPEGKTGCK